MNKELTISMENAAAVLDLYAAKVHDVSQSLEIILMESCGDVDTPEAKRAFAQLHTVAMALRGLHTDMRETSSDPSAFIWYGDTAAGSTALPDVDEREL